jgi:hypothetical protein
MTLLTLVVFLLGAYFLTVTVLKSSKRTSLLARNPYRATSIVYRAGACDAVKAIAGKRFLDVDRVTPSSPLPDCNAANCECKYTHHEDRRDYDEDRRLPRTLQSDLYDRTGKPDRRAKKRGRRKNDWA